MNIVDLFETLKGPIATAIAAVGGVWGAWKRSKTTNESLRTDLAKYWTNEGSIDSTEVRFVQINLRYEHGDLFGTVSGPAFTEVYDIHVTPRWFWANATVSYTRGRTPRLVAKARLRLKGNRNRLAWKITSLTDEPCPLPNTTILWPTDAPPQFFFVG